MTSDRDERGRFTGATPGPGRPPGTPNRTPLRETFQSVFGRLGGEAMLLRIAKKHPRDFLALLVKLEPRLLHADVDAEVHERASVRVVIPFNFRCDPALLGDTAHHETEAEATLRILERVEFEQERSLSGEDELTARRRWFTDLLAAARARLTDAQRGPAADKQKTGR